jgi:hypothetical protein
MMADPVTLTAISLGMTAASTAVSAAGALYAGQATAAAYRYKAGIDQMNANISQQMAGATMAEEQSRQAVQGLQLRAQRSQMVADVGARGLQLDKGSPAAMVYSSVEMGRIDQSMTQYDASKKAYGYEVQKAQAMGQKGVDLMGASAAETEGYLNMASAVLGGGASFSNKWLQASQSGSLGNSAGLTASVVG